jgi:predicted RNA-binding Zn-ribbon protein involved in translation (DUF1610 family)
VALWKGNDRRCFYCTEPILFKDLEIDHIIPEGIAEEEYVELQSRITLPAGFKLNGFENLVPAHHDCNNRKAGRLSQDKTILFYLEQWASKQDKVLREIEGNARAAKRDTLLIGVSNAIESGELSKHEFLQFLSKIQPPVESRVQVPLVITFGTNVAALLSAEVLPEKVRGTYVAACDWLERDLLFRVSSFLPILACQSEPSSREGETLSVRIAFWNLDFDTFDRFDIPNWEILEIADFPDIYEDSPTDLLARAVVKASSGMVGDPWDTAFGIGRCPRCGSDRLKRASSTDRYYDETYHTIDCEECGWSEWTQ